MKLLPEFKFTPFPQALEESVAWFVQNYDSVRTLLRRIGLISQGADRQGRQALSGRSLLDLAVHIVDPGISKTADPVATTAQSRMAHSA